MFFIESFIYHNNKSLWGVLTEIKISASGKYHLAMLMMGVKATRNTLKTSIYSGRGTCGFSEAYFELNVVRHKHLS